MTVQQAFRLFVYADWAMLLVGLAALCASIGWGLYAILPRNKGRRRPALLRALVGLLVFAMFFGTQVSVSIAWVNQQWTFLQTVLFALPLVIMALGLLGSIAYGVRAIVRCSGEQRRRAVLRSLLGIIVFGVGLAPHGVTAFMRISWSEDRLLNDRIASAFNKPGPLGARLDRALDDARLKYQRVLIVFADPQSEACRDLYRFYFDDLTAFEDYCMLCVDATKAKNDDVAAIFKESLRAQQIRLEPPGLLIVDSDGKLLTTADLSKMLNGREIDRKAVIELLKSHKPKLPDAEKMLADALEQAKRQEKCVLLEESGAYCGWCIKLARFIEAHRDLLGQDYVPIAIDPCRFEHGQQVMDRLRVSKNGGIPWMAILNAQGEVLVTSDGPNGNIGYPGTPEEIQHFLKMLRTTARRLTPEQFARLQNDLETAEAAKAVRAGTTPTPGKEAAKAERPDITATIPPAVEHATVNAVAASKSSSIDPISLLRAYETTLIPYQRFKVRWTERNFRLKEGKEREWLNTFEETLVRDGDRQKFSAAWKSNSDGDQSGRNWEEDCVEKGKTRISVHPARLGDNPNVPIVIGDFHVSDQDIWRTTRRAIPAGRIHGIWIPAFLKASKLSARSDTLDGRPVEVLQAVSGDEEVTLWLDAALGHMPKKICYEKHGSTPTSPTETIVYEVTRLEEKDGVLVPVEASETQRMGPRAASVLASVKEINGKPVLQVEPRKDKNGQIVMAPASTGLTEIELLDIQFDPKLADDDFKPSRPIPDGTKVSVSNEHWNSHVSYQWKEGKVIKVVEPAIQGKFDPAVNAKDQIAKKLQSAKWNNDRVLVIFGGNDWPRCTALEETFLSNPDTLLRLVDGVSTYAYQLVLADVTSPQNRALAAEYGLTLDDRQSPCMTILNPSGDVSCNQDLAEFEKDGRYDAARLIAFLRQWEPPGGNAADILHGALERAADEQKNTFVIVSGKSCVPCHRFTNFLAQWQHLLDPDYILVKIDQEQMSHVGEAKSLLKNPSDPGVTIPWYVILSPSGERLVTSMGPKGNIGFPSNQAGIDHFLAMIRQTARHIPPDELKALGEAMLKANQDR